MTKGQGNAIIGMLGILILLILMLSFGGLTAITAKLGAVSTKLDAIATKLDRPQLSARQAWEYQLTVISGNEGDIRRHLAELGSEGWEITSARWALGTGGTWGYECILRRPL